MTTCHIMRVTARLQDIEQDIKEELTMFRKVIAAALVLVAALSLAACGAEKAPAVTTAQTTAATRDIVETTTAAAETTTTVTEAPTEPATEPPTEPAPTEPKARVNETQLKQIQDRDTFPVNVKTLMLQENYYQEFSWDGNDAMLITIVNSRNEKITGFTLVALAVDQNGKDVGLGTLGGSMLTKSEADEWGCSSQVMLLSSDMEMLPGQEENFANRCDMEKFENMYMIVYSYTDASGNEVINENAIEWLSHTKPE